MTHYWTKFKESLILLALGFLAQRVLQNSSAEITSPKDKPNGPGDTSLRNEAMQNCNVCRSKIPEMATLCPVCKTYQSPWRAFVHSLGSLMIPWIAVVISIVSLIVSVLGSRESTRIAREALAITQATTKLGLEPRPESTTIWARTVLGISDFSMTVQFQQSM